MSIESAARTVVAFDPYPLWLVALGQLADDAGITFVGMTSDRLEALELVKELRPAMFLAGTDDVDSEPFRTVAEARQLAPALKIAAMSRMTDGVFMAAAFSAGADVFILKTATPRDLAAAIRQAFERTFFVAAKFAPGPSAIPEPPSLRLTRREREILRLVAEGHRNATMAQTLWVSEQTVKFHLSNLYKKLGVSNRTEAGRWAQVHGLLGGATVQHDADIRPLELEARR